MRALAGAVGLVVVGSGLLPGQELEPGLYQNAPVGLDAVILGYGFSTGNVLIDASLPLEDVDAKIHTLGLGYVRTLAVFEHSAKLDVQIPVAWSHFEGMVAGEQRTRSPSGLADPRLRFMVNFVGAPALAGAEYGTYRQGTVIGAGIQVGLPLGQYDPVRLINLGANRWSFRPEIGLSRKQGRVFVELATGAWVFTRNGNYFGGTTLEQDPLYFVKGDLVYNFRRRGSWVSVNYGYASGGETTIGGVAKQNIQTNSRAGVTLALPAGRAGSLKLTYTNGLLTRLGADFDYFGASYQRTWGGRGRRNPR